MLKKGTKLYSILTGNCPKCHKESMYKFNNPYNLSNIYSMNENCSHCGLKYQIEPSFFYGAMYVSYALTVGFGIVFFIISKILIGLNLLNSFIVIAIALVLLTPITARLSRNVYINIFVHFDENAAIKK